MAKKDRNKRAARKARQASRQMAEAQAVKAPEAQIAPADAKGPKAPKAEKAAKSGKPGLVARTRNYFGDVRSEMHRVVWPSKADLRNFTVAVIVLLVLFGVCIWLIDSGVVAALIGYSGLRG